MSEFVFKARAQSWPLSEGVVYTVGRTIDGPNDPSRLNVEGDKHLSRVHFTIRREGAGVRVERAPSGKNPLYYQEETKDSFLLLPGETFRTGKTVFLGAVESEEGPTIVADMTLPALQEAQSRAAGDCFRVMLDLLPELRANATEAPWSNALEVLGSVLEQAKFFPETLLALRVYPERFESRQSTHDILHEKRMPGSANHKPSLRLLSHGVNEGHSVGYVMESGASNPYTMAVDESWMVVTPIIAPDESHFALLAAGMTQGSVTKARLEETVAVVDIVGQTLSHHLAVQRVNRLEGQKEQLQEAATRQRDAVLDATLSEVTAWVAHDLNNTLQAAFSLSSTWADRDKPSPQKVMKAVNFSVTKAMDQIQELRNLAQPKETQKLRPVPVRSLISGVNLLVDTSLAKSGIEFDISGVDQSLVIPRASRPKLEDLLLNLIFNARNAIVQRQERQPEHRGRIEVKIRAGEEGTEFQVKDNGGGIPEEIRPQIFERRVVREGQTGSGLGLRSVKAAVNDHQGTISYESTLGEGTAFLMKIPS